MGYKYAEALAEHNEVTVIAADPAEMPEGVEGHAINIGPCNFNDVSASALMRFELRQLPKAWRLHRRRPFDVIHRVTPSAIQNPTFLPSLKVHFVIGPLLASDPPPRSFEPYLRRAVAPPRRGRYHPARIAAGLSSRILAAAARSHYHLRRATKILAGTQIALEHVPREYRDRCELITYAGVEHNVFVPGKGDGGKGGITHLCEAPSGPFRQMSDAPFSALTHLCEAPSGPFRQMSDAPFSARQMSDVPVSTLLYVGRLVQYKGIELLIRSVALAAKKCELRLKIIGGGEELYVAFLRQLVGELGIARIVEFAKPVARNELPQSYQNADIFCFPTICDTYGIALLEAMSCGCAVVVSDVAGPREIVAEGTGVKVPMCEPEQYITDYADAIVTLAGNPVLRCKLGAAARQHIVKNHDWRSISARLLEIYDGFAR